MTSHTASKIIALALGAAVSITCFDAIVLGMQTTAKPAPRTIELPTVVVVGHRSAALDATAQTKADGLGKS